MRKKAVLGIRIRRILMFLSLPDPLVDVRIRIHPFSYKGVQRIEIMLAK